MNLHYVRGTVQRGLNCVVPSQTSSSPSVMVVLGSMFLSRVLPANAPLFNTYTDGTGEFVCSLRVYNNYLTSQSLRVDILGSGVAVISTQRV